MKGSPTGLFVGLSTLDVIQLVEAIPGANEKVVALDYMIAAGGPATNAAVAFSVLGGRAVLVTKASGCLIGQSMVGDLQSYGVEVLVVCGCETPAIATIMITAGTGERAVVSASEMTHLLAVREMDSMVGRDSDELNSRVKLGVDDSILGIELDLDELDSRLGKGEVEFDFGIGLVDRLKPDVVLVDSYEIDASLPITREARAALVPVVLDCGVKKDWTPTQLPFVDVAVVPSVYLPGGPQAIADDLTSDGVRFGAVTDGADPIWWWVHGEPELKQMPVPKVPVVDTLGAGDFFPGALAFALARDGLSGPSFEQGLSFAAEVAALSVQSFGSRSWLDNLSV